MPTRSAGILPFRHRGGRLEVFLCHPGGPFWAKKDVHAWSFPKGEYDEEQEDALAAAKREFREETGQTIDGEFIALTPRRTSGNKIVHAWAVEATPNENAVVSNEFELEWPPRSGHRRWFPEVDRAAWFGLAEARTRIHKGLVPILDELESLHAAGPSR